MNEDILVAYFGYVDDSEVGITSESELLEDL